MKQVPYWGPKILVTAAQNLVDLVPWICEPQFSVLPTEYFCDFSVSQNKQRLFTHTALTGCFLCSSRNMFTAVGERSLQMRFVVILVFKEGSEGLCI